MVIREDNGMLLREQRGYCQHVDSFQHVDVSTSQHVEVLTGLLPVIGLVCDDTSDYTVQRAQILRLLLRHGVWCD